MKPYPHKNLDKPKRIFNYWLSKARCVVENGFRILANRFRVFLTTINFGPERAVNIILAACCLHNFMVENNMQNYMSGQDIEDTEHLQFTSGHWRSNPQLVGLQASSVRNSTNNAKEPADRVGKLFLIRCWLCSMARIHV